MSRGLGARDAVVIFPEGGNFTAERRRGHRAAAAPRPPRAGRAGARDGAPLAPRPGGALAALESAPDADVVFMAHYGFPDGLDEVWRALGEPTAIDVQLWHVPAAELPPATTSGSAGCSAGGRRSTPGSPSAATRRCRRSAGSGRRSRLSRGWRCCGPAARRTARAVASCGGSSCSYMASAVGNSSRIVRSRTVRPYISGSSRSRTRSSLPHSAGERMPCGRSTYASSPPGSPRGAQAVSATCPAGFTDARQFVRGPPRAGGEREPERRQHHVEAVVGMGDVLEVEQVAGDRRSWPTKLAASSTRWPSRTPAASASVAATGASAAAAARGRPRRRRRARAASSPRNRCPGHWASGAATRAARACSIAFAPEPYCAASHRIGSLSHELHN